jgi:hypothetical protein
VTTAIDIGAAARRSQTAADLDRRGALLGRLDASHDKRERLDAEASLFHAALRADRRADAAGVSQWEDEGGAMVVLRPSADVPEVGQPGDTLARPEPDEPAPATSLQALRYAGLTMIIALPVMIVGYKWFMG